MNINRIGRCFLLTVMAIGWLSLTASPLQAQTSKPGSISDIVNDEQPAIDPEWTAACKRHSDLVVEATNLYNAGKLAEAAKKFEEANRIDPMGYSDTLTLPQIYRKQERWNDLIALFRKVERKRPLGYDFELFPYALALAKVGSMEAAVKMYYRCLDILPKDSSDLPISLQLRFDGDPASIRRSHLEAAIRIAYGMNDWHHGQRKSAVTHFRSALSVYPNTSLIHYYMGNILVGSMDRSERDEGKALLERAAQSGSPTTAGVARHALKDSGLLK